MSFGSNVLFYRKKFGITQEALAEKLEVTRQTVSRWETDSAFPDMDKLLILCDLFGCNMEVLVRGNAEAENAQRYEANLEAYNKHMNVYTAQITSGVTLILAGVTAMLFLSAVGIREVVGLVTFFVCITLAVFIFVAGGVAHGNFMRENPRVEKYSADKVSVFRRKLPWFIAGATALILIGVIAVVAMTYEEGYAPEGFTLEGWEGFAAGILLTAVTIASGLYVYAGMQSAKYDVKNYNKECRKEGYLEESDGGENVPVPEEREKKSERLIGSISSVIMLSATAVYLALGFLRNLWHPGWVVFAIGGILCGIVSVVVKAIYGEK